MLNPSILIPILAYVACAVLVAVRFARHKKNIRELGNCLLELPRQKTRLVIAICIAAACVIGFLFVRTFALWITIVFALCAVMAVELALNDMLLRTCSGVYENGLITDGKLIFRRDVVSFPQLFYENDDEQLVLIPETVLQVVTIRGLTVLVFETAADRNAAMDLVKSWR